MIYCRNCRFHVFHGRYLHATCQANPSYTLTKDTWYQWPCEMPVYALCEVKNAHNSCQDFKPNWWTQIGLWADRWMNKWME
jgi:hypothetical protein